MRKHDIFILTELDMCHESPGHGDGASIIKKLYKFIPFLQLKVF